MAIKGSKNVYDKIKNGLEKRSDEKVVFFVKTSRGRCERIEGTLEGLYPHLFTVRACPGGRSISVSYSDVVSGRVTFLKE